MADTEIKNKVMHGLFWKILENGGAQGIQFVIAIILARLLSPAEYGLVSIIMIFITIANVVVQNGFSTALVQKRHSDDVDFSSVFYFSLAIAAAMYVVLYMAAPSIAGFYRNDVLVPIVRVLSVVLFPGAVISVQTAYVSRKMEFKGLFKATMAAVLVSGAVSITMAFRGLGVWAMVGQQLSYYLALMTALFVTVSWKPGFMFAIGRVRAMFAFGWKLLLAALLDTLFNNLYGLIMGKIYNEELLGAYNRGDQFPKLIVNNLGAAIQAVLLPAFSSRQGDIAQVRSMVRRAIRTSSFLVLPMLLGLFAVADTMVLALLGEKWMICVPYLRIMCIAYSFWPIHITNLQAINAVGRSDIFLKLEVIKKSIGIMGLVIGAMYSPVILVSIKAGIDFLCTFINAWPNKKLLGYSISSQWMDIMPSMALSAVMCIFVYFLQFALPGGPWGKLVMQIVAGALFYGGAAWILKMESFMYLQGMIKRRGSSQA
ncbi:lipopolysaccharide biosynthesis protein [Enterocloster citroniae]|uniref:lipopolysaccharide biosynthesis protein n=1 Tax=Enterocloster citroniae TaxID=358743 RepID=UPI002ED57800